MRCALIGTAVPPWSARVVAPRRANAPESSAAAEEAGQPGDAATDDEPGHRGADDHLLLVALEVLAPVRRLRELRAQRAQGALELHAVGLDRGADLLRCALGHV